MKKLRLRISNGVDVNNNVYSATIKGGSRGFCDALALETYSNDVAPTILTIESFTLIVLPYEK